MSRPLDISIAELRSTIDDPCKGLDPAQVYISGKPREVENAFPRFVRVRGIPACTIRIDA